MPPQQQGSGSKMTEEQRKFEEQKRRLQQMVCFCFCYTVINAFLIPPFFPSFFPFSNTHKTQILPLKLCFPFSLLNVHFQSKSSAKPSISLESIAAQLGVRFFCLHRSSFLALAFFLPFFYSFTAFLLPLSLLVFFISFPFLFRL